MSFHSIQDSTTSTFPDDQIVDLDQWSSSEEEITETGEPINQPSKKKKVEKARTKKTKVETKNRKESIESDKDESDESDFETNNLDIDNDVLNPTNDNESDYSRAPLIASTECDDEPQQPLSKKRFHDYSDNDHNESDDDESDSLSIYSTTSATSIASIASSTIHQSNSSLSHYAKQLASNQKTAIPSILMMLSESTETALPSTTLHPLLHISLTQLPNKVKVSQLPTYISSILHHQHTILPANLLTWIAQIVPKCAIDKKYTKALLNTLVSIFVGRIKENRDMYARELALKVLTELKCSVEIQSVLVRKVYLQLINTCGLYSVSTAYRIERLVEMAVQWLNALDYSHVVYKYAFVYIRQIAIHIRSADSAMKPTYKLLFSLLVWSRVVKEELMYPLVELVLGIAQRTQHTLYKLRLLEIVVDVNVYVPLLPLLIELVPTTKPTNNKTDEFEYKLLLPKEYNQSAAYQKYVGIKVEWLIGKVCSKSVYLQRIAWKEWVSGWLVVMRKKGLKEVVGKILETIKEIEAEGEGMEWEVTELKKLNGMSERKWAIDEWVEKMRRLNTAVSSE